MEKKMWNERTLEEQKASVLNQIKNEIVSGIKNGNAVFYENVDFSKKERAYNPSNGLPYKNFNSLLLDMKQKEGNYEKNQWISLSDARFLGATDEELKKVFESEVPKVRVHFLKTTELRPIFERDSNGDKIPLLDENGNPRFSSRTGETLYQCKYVEQLDSNGQPKLNEEGKPYMKIATERVEIAPTYETDFLYNVSEFQTINKARLKPLDRSIEESNRHTFKHKDPNLESKYIVIDDLHQKIYPEVLRAIKNYMYAQNLKGVYECKLDRNTTKEKQQAIENAEVQKEAYQAEKNEAGKTTQQKVSRKKASAEHSL